MCVFEKEKANELVFVMTTGEPEFSRDPSFAG